METESAAAQLTNTKRKLNMDRYRLLGGRVPLVAKAGRGQVFAVFDGVSDAPKGGLAAGAVAGALDAFFRPATEPTAEALAALLLKADAEIAAWGSIEGSAKSLGAAVGTVVWVSPEDTLHVFHAGDTRALLYDGENSVRLTGAEGVSGYAVRNCFGCGRVKLDQRSTAVEEGMTLVLVTDGVTKKLNDEEVVRALLDATSPERAAREVVNRARALRSDDDITCVVVEFVEAVEGQ